mgnify:CR=1 FL=1
MVSNTPGVVPRKTHSLERVFNRAFTQVLFSGRQQMLTIDLYLSMRREQNLDSYKLDNVANTSSPAVLDAIANIIGSAVFVNPFLSN